MPPLHPNCRIQLLPKVSGMGIIGDQTSVDVHKFQKAGRGDNSIAISDCFDYNSGQRKEQTVSINQYTLSI